MNEQTVFSAALTVSYWRERLAQIRPDKLTLKELAEKLGEVDPYFSGLSGHGRLMNILNKRAALEPTARTVLLIEKLGLARQPIPPPLPANTELPSA